MRRLTSGNSGDQYTRPEPKQHMSKKARRRLREQQKQDTANWISAKQEEFKQDCARVFQIPEQMLFSETKETNNGKAE